MSEAVSAVPGNPGQDLLKIAGEAAAAGDYARMLDALVQSRFLDGLYRYIQSQWRVFDADDASILIGQAVDNFFSKASSGATVGSPPGYIFKTLQKIAATEYERRSRETPLEGNETEKSDYLEWKGTTLYNTVPRPERIQAALKIARQLLRETGEENIQAIGRFYLEAVESGVEDIDDEQMAAAVHLDVETAKRLKRRFLQRLRREVKKAGIRICDVFGEDIFKESPDE